MPAPFPFLMTMTTLTPSQEAAVLDPNPNRLVIAGPGSGKTHTTIAAIDRDCLELDFGPVHPQDCIVAITYTNKAANELRERLEAASIHPFFVGTLHSFCLHVIRHHRGRDFAIVGEQESEAILKGLIASLRTKATVGGCLKVLAGEREALIAEAPVLAQYRKTLTQGGAIDFGQILTLGLSLMGGFTAPAGAPGWLLYVDEYQDSAPIDAAIYEALPCAKRWVVGDPNQCIFEFRGATLDNILALAQGDGWSLHRIEENFRSAPCIVHASFEVIRGNSALFSQLRQRVMVDREGELALKRYDTAIEETAAIIKATQPGTGEWAILCRYNHDRDAIETALRAAGADVALPPPPMPRDFRVLIALLGLMANPGSRIAADAWFRATKTPSEAQTLIENRATVPKTWPDEFPHWDAFASALITAGISRPSVGLARQACSEAGGSLSPVRLLAVLLAPFRQPPVPRCRISVLTMHGAKGLEFENVWIAATDLAGGLTNPDAERRLFYVAMTRAKRTLTISWSRTRPNHYTGTTELRSINPFADDIPRLTGC